MENVYKLVLSLARCHSGTLRDLDKTCILFWGNFLLNNWKLFLFVISGASNPR